MESLRGLRVCRFGSFDAAYARNRVVAACLRRAGAEVVDVHDLRPSIRRTWPLVRRALRERFDLVLVSFRAHTDVFAARLVASIRGVPLLFDPLVSRYDERVVDRRSVSPRSALARWYFASDWMALRLATRVLLETETNVAYLAETFGVPAARFRRLWLGADDEVMRPAPWTSGGPGPFRVFFYGRFSPLHGAEHIVAAARLLERRGPEVAFTLVGGGQTYERVRQLAGQLGASSVRFVPPVPFDRLAGMMAESDLCLGAFGETARAARVVPNKVFDALAVARPVLTADTPGIREALVPGEHLWTCAAGSPEAIADAITALAADRDLGRRLAAAGHARFVERFSIEALTRDLSAIVLELLSPSA